MEVPLESLTFIGSHDESAEEMKSLSWKSKEIKLEIDSSCIIKSLHLLF